MSTYVQSASSSPTARDLLELLTKMKEEGKDLDKPFMYWDGEYGYTRWEGELELDAEGEQNICLSYDPNDAVKAEIVTARRDNERLQAECDAAHPSPVDLEKEEYRRKGLLP
jgi:hypothetical protein